MAANGDVSKHTCMRCGRALEQRSRYCSQRCRRARLSAVDRALEQTILELLAKRACNAKDKVVSICPSDAARALFAEENAWRAHMEPAREAARRLVAQGRLEVTQRGKVVDPATARGPIRLRLPRSGGRSNSSGSPGDL